jgi:hypothetical protein
VTIGPDGLQPVVDHQAFASMLRQRRWAENLGAYSMEKILAGIVFALLILWVFQDTFPPNKKKK